MFCYAVIICNYKNCSRSNQAQYFFAVWLFCRCKPNWGIVLVSSSSWCVCKLMRNSWLWFETNKVVNFLKEQFYIMKPKEILTRSFKIYPTSDQASKYVCAGIILVDNFFTCYPFVMVSQQILIFNTIYSGCSYTKRFWF